MTDFADRVKTTLQRNKDGLTVTDIMNRMGYKDSPDVREKFRQCLNSGCRIGWARKWVDVNTTVYAPPVKIHHQDPLHMLKPITENVG